MVRYRDEARRGAHAAPEDGAEAGYADQLAGRVEEGTAGVALAGRAVAAGVHADAALPVHWAVEGLGVGGLDDAGAHALQARGHVAGETVARLAPPEYADSLAGSGSLRCDCDAGRELR